MEFSEVKKLSFVLFFISCISVMDIQTWIKNTSPIFYIINLNKHVVAI